MLTLRNRGVGNSPEVHEEGRYVLSVVSSGGGPPSLVRGPKLTASCLERASAGRHPDFSNGVSHLPLPDGMLPSFEPRQPFLSRNAVASGEARDGCPSDPKKIIKKLHSYWGRASAQGRKRVLVDSDRENMHLSNYVDEV